MKPIEVILSIAIVVFSILLILFASNFASYAKSVSDNASDLFNNRGAVSSFTVAAIMAVAVCVSSWLLYKATRNH